MDWIRFVTNDKQCLCFIKHKEVDKNINGLAASLKTIQNIINKYPPPYTLLCSGGIDSQAMAYAWKISGIQHQVITYEYVNYDGSVFNDFDLKSLINFSNIHNIKFFLKKINYIKFLNDDLLNYAKKYDCASPQITLYMKMADTIGNGTIIFSGNYYNSANIMLLNYDILGLYRFSQQTKNYKVIPFFFLHDTETAFGFQPIPESWQFLEGYEIKTKTYHYNGFPVLPQERKYSGFEKIKDFFDKKGKLITGKDRLRFLNKQSQRPFDIKYRYMLREQLGKEPEFKIIIE